MEVVSVDRKRRQLVLSVEEPVRKFLVERRRGIWVEQKTSARRVKYLLGLDEAHCFIAELPEGNNASVVEAHARLRPDSVKAALAESRPVLRQGEWFFVPATPEEKQALARLAGPVGNLVAVGPGRKPHVADELVSLPLARLVRGRVYHPDHHPLRLNDWYSVHHNNEVQIRFGTWFD